MTNRDLIIEFIAGTKKYNAVNHLAYAADTIWNYSTDLCVINREKKTAVLNSNRYSNTTSKIQSQIRAELSRAGYEIVESKDFRFGGTWNYGYQGAPSITRRDAEKIYYITK